MSGLLALSCFTIFFVMSRNSFLSGFLMRNTRWNLLRSAASKGSCSLSSSIFSPSKRSPLGLAVASTRTSAGIFSCLPALS